MAFFQDCPVLENTIIQFQDFPGFPGPVRTLSVARALHETGEVGGGEGGGGEKGQGEKEEEEEEEGGRGGG